MSSSWDAGLADVNPVRARPLVGRRRYLEAAAETLRSGSAGAVLLVAEPGLGKSALAEAIADKLSDEMIVMRVHGSPSLAKVPYGVLAPYLVDLPEDPTNSQVAILRAFWAQFERLRAGRDLPLLLLVDDAHELDSATANVIVDLITANWAKVVASCRSQPGLPESLMRLWYDSMAERFDLEPLSRADIGDVVEQILGGPVLPGASQMLWRVSEGNPLLLNCLIEDARADGSLVRRNGVWLLKGPLAAGGPALTGMVRNQLLRRTPLEREALTMIALAEPVSLGAFEAAAGADMVQTLVESQLVEIVGDDQENLRLRHPVYGEALRSIVSSSRSFQLRQRLLNYPEHQPGSDAALLRMVNWSIESGVKVPDSQLLNAAVHAARTFQNEAAVSLADRITSTGLWSQARAAASRAYFNAGRYKEAVKSMTAGGGHGDGGGGTRGDGQGPARPGTELLDAHVRMALLSARQAGPVTVTGRNTGVLTTVRPGPLSRLLELDLSGNFAELGQQLELLGPGLRTGAGAGQRGLMTAFLSAVLADVHRAQGDPAYALREADKAAEHVGADDRELFFIREFVLYRQLAAAADAGEWGRLGKLVAGYEAEAGSGLATFDGTIQCFRGLSFLRQGRFEKAFAVFRPAIEALRLSDPQQLLRPALGMAAYAAVRAGERQQAQSLLTQSDGYRGSSAGADAALGPVFAAAARETLFRDGVGLAGLQGLLDATAPAVTTMVRLQALVLCLELGSPAAARETRELAKGMSGALAGVWARYAELRETADAGVAMDAAEALLAAGLVRMARESFARAASLFEARGEPSKVRQANLRQEQCDRDLGGQRSGAPAGQNKPSPVQLTRRERDIILLAVKGLTDRQIADKLMVSVRTVEGHLYRSYAKLGVRRREELAGAVDL